jgi:Flp pilus assembly protein TadG
MSRPGHVLRRTSDERGAIGVLVAIILPVFIFFGSFVLDVGNAFVHHRHLQLQADAAALGGGYEFGTSPCSDSNIVGRALEYSSITKANTNWSSQTLGSFADTGSPYNAQVGGTSSSNMWEAINSQTWLPSGNTAAADPTTFTGSPCGDSMLDVKVTETNLPWYLQAGGLNYMNAHARVSWSATGAGFLPLAVDETSPLAATAYFVDETSGAVIASAPLVNSHTLVGGSGAYASDEVWSSVASPASVPVSTSTIGVIIALSGDPTTTSCSASPVTCFPQNTGGTGDDLVRIQGYSASSGSQASPNVQSVTLSGGTCVAGSGATDGYYSVSTGTSNCTVGVNAKVDVGGANPSGMQVQASVGGTQTPLVFAGGVWSGTVSIAGSSAANDIDLWICGYGNFLKCDKNNADIVSNVHATFAANDNPPSASSTKSGTIDGVIVSQLQGGVLMPHANSFPICGTGSTTVAACTPQLVVTADIGGSLHDAASTSDPLFALNFGSQNTSSQTGTVVCPPGTNSASTVGNTLLTGCPGSYVINYSTTTNSFSDPSCINTNPTPGPADCVQAKNGGSEGQISPNLFARFVSAGAGGKWYCSNNWSSFNPAKPFDGLPPDDDRIIPLFVIPYNSFSGGGSNGRIVPIVDGAYFYVMGWSLNGGGNNNDPCASDPPDPQSGTKGDRIWGHFIRYTNPNAPPSTSPCKNSALGGCVIALTQ